MQDAIKRILDLNTRMKDILQAIPESDKSDNMIHVTTFTADSAPNTKGTGFTLEMPMGGVCITDTYGDDLEENTQYKVTIEAFPKD